MDVQLVFKIAGVGILTSVCCQIVSRSGRDEQATFISIAGIVIVLLLLVEKIGELLDSVRSVFGI